MIGVPELKGHLWVGRAKEGISLNMIMVGYAGWTMERSHHGRGHRAPAGGWREVARLPAGEEAALQPRLVHRRAQRRPVVLCLRQPVHRPRGLAADPRRRRGRCCTGARRPLRHGEQEHACACDRGPSSNVAPYFVDTQPFEAADTGLGQFEVYYRPGPLLLGMEYFVQQVDAIGVHRSHFPRRRRLSELADHR